MEEKNDEMILERFFYDVKYVNVLINGECFNLRKNDAGYYELKAPKDKLSAISSVSVYMEDESEKMVYISVVII